MIRQTRDLDDQLRDALKRHKDASDRVIKRSLDQVQRTHDVQVALHSISERIDSYSAVRTMHGAYDLVREGGPPDDDNP
jgi:hypothetical protein